MPSGYLATDNPEGPRRRSIACFVHGCDGERCRWIYIYIYCSIVHRSCFAVLSSSTNRDPREIIEHVAMIIFVFRLEFFIGRSIKSCDNYKLLRIIVMVAFVISRHHVRLTNHWSMKKCGIELWDWMFFILHCEIFQIAYNMLNFGFFKSCFVMEIGVFPFDFLLFLVENSAADRIIHRQSRNYASRISSKSEERNEAKSLMWIIRGWLVQLKVFRRVYTLRFLSFFFNE